MNKKILVLFGIVQTYAALASVTHLDVTEDQRRTYNANRLQKINVNANFISSLLNEFFGNGTGKTGNSDVDDIVKTVKDAFRSKDTQSAQNIKPVLVKFRSNEPSLMFEVNSHAILGAIKKLVNSESLEKYSQVFARKAANALRTIVQKNDAENNEEY